MEVEKALLFPTSNSEEESKIKFYFLLHHYKNILIDIIFSIELEVICKKYIIGYYCDLINILEIKKK